MNIAALKHEMNSVNCQAQEGKQLFPDTHTHGRFNKEGEG